MVGKKEIWKACKKGAQMNSETQNMFEEPNP